MVVHPSFNSSASGHYPFPLVVLVEVLTFTIAEEAPTLEVD